MYALNLADKNVNPIAQISTFGDVLNVLIPILMVVVGLLFFFMLIAGAFSWLTSGGNPEKLKKAQATLTSAFIGLIIVLCSYLIIKLIGYAFNIQMPL